MDFTTSEIVTIVIYAMAAFGVYQVFARLKAFRRRMIWKKYDIRDATNQKRFVSQARFFRKPLMNKSEYRIYQILDRWIACNSAKGFRLFSQVSIGEYMGSKDKRAYRSINSKRVDFLIIDPFGKAVLAVEYQGAGHDQGNARDRDEVKALAHQKAKIGFIEIFSNDDEAAIIDKIDINLHLRDG